MRGPSLTFPPEPYLMSHFQPILMLSKKAGLVAPHLPCLSWCLLRPWRLPTPFSLFSLSPSAGLSVPQGVGGSPGTPQLLTGLQALQDLPWPGLREALGPGSAVLVPTQRHPHWRVAWLWLWWVPCCAQAGLGLAMLMHRTSWNIPLPSHACELLSQAQPCPSGSPRSAHRIHVLQPQPSS